MDGRQGPGGPPWSGSSNTGTAQQQPAEQTQQRTEGKSLMSSGYPELKSSHTVVGCACLALVRRCRGRSGWRRVKLFMAQRSLVKRSRNMSRVQTAYWPVCSKGWRCWQQPWSKKIQQDGLKKPAEIQQEKEDGIRGNGQVRTLLRTLEETAHQQKGIQAARSRDVEPLAEHGLRRLWSGSGRSWRRPGRQRNYHAVKVRDEQVKEHSTTRWTGPRWAWRWHADAGGFGRHRHADSIDGAVRAHA